MEVLEKYWIKSDSIRKFEKSAGLFMEINVGDIVRLKKPHPCGSFEWKVLRSGADFRLCCCGCGHQVMISRRDLEKRVKNIEPHADNLQ